MLNIVLVCEFSIVCFRITYWICYLLATVVLNNIVIHTLVLLFCMYMNKIKRLGLHVDLCD